MRSCCHCVHVFSCVQVGKSYATKASKATSRAEAEAVQAEGIAAVKAALMKNGKGIVYEAQRLSSTMSKVPQIDLVVPTVRSLPPLPCMLGVQCRSVNACASTTAKGRWP
jgi:DNA transposition AAA+ family ATPase